MIAEDVKFSLDRYRSPPANTLNAAQFRKPIKDVAVIENLAVRVDLNEPMLTWKT